MFRQLLRCYPPSYSSWWRNCWQDIPNKPGLSDLWIDLCCDTCENKSLCIDLLISKLICVRERTPVRNASRNFLKYILLFIFSVCHSVRLLKDSVIPPHALKGHQAVLRCNYDMEGDDLYSVKWYYNQKEFYRFIPSDNPKVTIFNHHKGVKVNVSSTYLRF